MPTLLNALCCSDDDVVDVDDDNDSVRWTDIVNCSYVAASLHMASSVPDWPECDMSVSVTLTCA